MGMYNEISVPCKNCGKSVIFQTKSGSCTLSSFSIDDCPPSEFKGIMGDMVACEHCDTVMEIVDPSKEKNEDFSSFVS